MFFLLMMEGDGDEEKFLQLYDTFKHRMFYIAYRILEDKELAEDAVQESLLYLAMNIKKVDDVQSNKTRNYMYIVTKHKALDIVRKSCRYRDDRELQEIDFASYQGQSPDLEETYISEQGISRIIDEIAKLPVLTRECIELNVLHDMTPKQIGELLHLDRKVVKQRIYRGKKVLRDILTKGD